MKTTLQLTAYFVLLSFGNVFAQHSLQLDDGLGAYSIIKGSASGGIYTLPNVPGTLLTSGSLGSFTWLTAGNSLTGGTPQTPNEFLGTINNYDLIFKSNNQSHLILGANGNLGLSTNTIVPASASYPLNIYNWNNTGTPPLFTQLITQDLLP